MFICIILCSFSCVNEKKRRKYLLVPLPPSSAHFNYILITNVNTNAITHITNRNIKCCIKTYSITYLIIVSSTKRTTGNHIREISVSQSVYLLVNHASNSRCRHLFHHVVSMSTMPTHFSVGKKLQTPR